MDFVVELENELKELERVRKIMIENTVFIQEEITIIENRIKHIKDILSVLKD